MHRHALIPYIKYMVHWVVCKNVKRTNFTCGFFCCRFLSHSAFAYTAFDRYRHPTLYMGTAMLPDLFTPRVGMVDSLGAMILRRGLEGPSAGYHFIRMDKIRNGGAELMKCREEFAKMYSQAVVKYVPPGLRIHFLLH